MKDHADLKGISASWNEIAKKMLKEEFDADFDPNSGKEGKYHKFSCPMCSDGDKLKEAYAFADKAVFINCPRENHCSYSVQSGNDINLTELFPDRFPKDPNYKPPPKKKIKPAKNELDGIRKISKGEKLSEKEKELIKLEKSGTPLEYFEALNVTQSCFYKGDSTWFGWTVEKEGQEPKKFVRLILEKRIEREFIYKIKDKKGEFFGYDFHTGIKYGNRNFIIPNELFGDLSGFNKFINKKNPNCKSGIDRKCFQSLNILIKEKEVREVEKIDTCGQVKPGEFIFPHFMIKNGNLYRKEGHYIKGCDIVPPDYENYLENIDEDFNVRKIGDLVYDAWGPKGIIVLGYLTISLFYDHLPYRAILSLFGLPNCGKTKILTILMTAIKFHNKSLENKISQSSKAGTARKIASTTGMPHYFSEANKVEGEKVKLVICEDDLLRFHEHDLRRLKGLRTDGLETQEDEIDGGMVFAQNTEFWVRPATKQRVISLEFKKEDFTPNTKTALERLELLKDSELGNLGVTLMKKHKEIVAALPDIWEEVEEIYQGMDSRMTHVHGSALAGVKILERFANFHTFPVQQYSLDTAKKNFAEADSTNEELQEFIEQLVQSKVGEGLKRYTQPVEKKDGQKFIFFNLAGLLDGDPRAREIKALFRASGVYEPQRFKHLRKMVRSYGIPEGKISEDNKNIILRTHAQHLSQIK